MTEITKTKIQNYTAYIADDGEEFSSKIECERHEKYKTYIKLFTLLEKRQGGNIFRGAFSTKDKAEKWISGLNKEYQDNFLVIEEYLDEHERLCENK